MATESLGQAKIEVVVDSDGYQAGLNKAAAATSKFTGEAQKQYDSLTAAEKRNIDSLNRRVGALGLSVDKQLEANIAMRSSGALQDDLNKKLELGRIRLQQSAKEFDKYGMTAKQYTAAMRGVPAQITDIAVSLQGGQRPLTVLLQQGGQLKDMFGGVVPAAKALGAGLMGLINPYTLAAAAGAALFTAWYQGSEEAKAYSAALIMTGNSAGKTTEQLAILAQELDNVSGVTESQAAAAITAVVNTGRIAGENISLVAEAALAMQRVTGKAIEDTVAEFVELEKDPVKAILKLNETQRFLTEGTLAQIKAFQEQGEASKAAALATEEYANTLIERTSQVTENLGFLQSAWRGVANGAKEAWDFMLGVGRQETAADKIKQLQSNIEGLQAGTGLYRDVSTDNRQRLIADMQKSIRDLQTEANKQPVTVTMAGIYATVDPETQKARDEFDKLRLSNLSKEQKLEKEINQIRQLGAKAGIAQAEIDKQIAAAREKDRNKSAGRGAAGVANAAASRELQAFKDQLSKEEAAIKNSREVLQAEYQAKSVSVEDYYARLKQLSQQGTKAETAAIEGQIAVLQRRNVTGRDSENVQRQLLTLETQLAKARSDGASEQQVLDVQAAAALQKRTQAIQAYAAALDNTTLATEREMKTMAMKVSMGDREFEVQTRINSVYEKQADLLRELALQKTAGQIDEATYEANVAAIERSSAEQVAAVREGYDELAAAQGDWLNGASAAYANWLADSQNVAKQTQDMFTSAFDAIGDAIGDFVTTGKLDMKSLLSDLLAQIAKFMAQKAIMEFVASFAGGGSSGNNAGGFADLFSDSYMSGFAQGGYTGPGGVNQPAGVVHRGEVVWSQGDVARAGGVAAVEAMRRGFKGYATGGAVGVTAPYANGSIGAAPMQIVVQQNFEVNTANGSVQENSDTAGQQQFAKELAERMKVTAQETIQQEQMAGGSIYNFVRRGG